MKPDDRKRARRNLILGWVHALIAIAIVLAFVYTQSKR